LCLRLRAAKTGYCPGTFSILFGGLRSILSVLDYLFLVKMEKGIKWLRKQFKKTAIFSPAVFPVKTEFSF
jgi:hypothetical protein